MATQPTVATELQTIEKRIGLFFDPAHLLLTGLLVIAVVFGVYHFVSRRADQADGRAAVAQAVAKQAADDAAASAKTNAELQAATTQQLAAIQQANAALQQQNAQITKTLADSIAALKAAQATNITRTPNERAARWHELVPGATVSPIAGGGYTLDENSGLDTLNALENLPILSQRTEALTKQLANDDQIIANDAVALKKEQDAHKADTDNDAKQLTACTTGTKKVQADFDAYKEKARKREMKIAAVFTVLGVVARHFVGF